MAGAGEQLAHLVDAGELPGGLAGRGSPRPENPDTGLVLELVDVGRAELAGEQLLGWPGNPNRALGIDVEAPPAGA